MSHVARVVALLVCCCAAFDAPRPRTSTWLRSPHLPSTLSAATPSLALEHGPLKSVPAQSSQSSSFHRMLVAYLLWVFPFTGLAGAHHLYLGRNRAAFVSSISCGGFLLGWLADFWKIPAYIRALTAAEAAAKASETGVDRSDDASGVQAVPVPVSSSAVSSGSGTEPRYGVFSSFFRLLCRVSWRLQLSLWFAFCASLSVSREQQKMRLFMLPIGTLLHVVSALAAVSVTASAADAPLPIAQPRLLTAMLFSAMADARATVGDSDVRLSLPIVVASLLTSLPYWRRPVDLTPPRRSIRDGLLATAAAAAFWTWVLMGSLMRVPVELTADGTAASLTAYQLITCSLCALRPDRLTHMLQTFREHVCIKRNLEAALKRQFERLCILPQSLNKCLDWDVSGTRWQLVGLTLKEAYSALGLSPRASTREVKAAYHRAALANHPDKVGGTGTAAAEEAAIIFMKAQKAFEKIMEVRKPSSHPPSSAPPQPKPRSRPSKPAASSAKATRKPSARASGAGRRRPA